MITVIGKNSQLCRTFLEESAYNIDLLDKQCLDLTRLDSIQSVLKNYKNKVILNFASFNDVLNSTSKDANIINHLAMLELAKFCSKNKIFLVHISTDYVFRGDKGFYDTTDAPDPINDYGKSKLNGELAIKSILNESLIIRTSWLYSSFDTQNNFLHKILNSFLVENKETFYGAIDIFGSPTSTKSLARFLEIVLKSILHKDPRNYFGTYHFCDTGRISRYEFVAEILNLASQITKKNFNLIRVNQDFFKEPISRPIDSSLDNYSSLKKFDIKSIFWKEALNISINEYIRKYQRES